MIHEFYRIAFRRRFYRTLAELQADPATVVGWHNHRRAHSRHRLRGRTPAAFFHRRQRGSELTGVLARLPADGIPTSVLANLETGDGHALDPDSRLPALVLPAVARLGGLPPGKGCRVAPDGLGGRRRAHGELTNPVLALNLPGDRTTPAGRALACWAEVASTQV